MRQLGIAVALIAACGLLAGPAGAQQQQRRQGQGQGRFGGGLFGGQGVTLMAAPAPVQEKLKLDAGQKEKLAAIREKMSAEMRANFQGGGQGQRPGPEVIQKITAMREKSESEAVALLSPDQKKQWDGMKADAEKYQGIGRGSMALMAVDGLTADQKSKLAALAQEIQGKRREMLQGAAQGGDRQAVGQKMRELDTQTTDAVKKILTPEQAKQYDAAQPQGQFRRPNRNIQ